MRPTAGRSGLVQAGNAELFAELGADYLTNMPYNLAYRGREWNALPSRTAAKLDNYFTGTIHKLPARQRRVAAAAADPSGEACTYDQQRSLHTEKIAGLQDAYGADPHRKSFPCTGTSCGCTGEVCTSWTGSHPPA